MKQVSKTRIGYRELNPAELHREIIRLQNRLLEMVMLKEEVRHTIRPVCHRKGNSWYAYV